ncbi:(Fe-S)-binding protein [Carboxylicivirga sediminis]|uniref:(Fe-S)-binding protein n=2 Tax=Carboxylicivirga sediminis TaxID=2006564 RepID=A0A941EZP4_9BACT|nr:(Fe-S)-binding protein [Carboxylicivirga sediminis]
MAEVSAQGHQPEYLFWVGCAGAFDKRYQKVTRAFAQILNAANIDYAVLGTEETCTGDPAKRAGNEMLFQMQAMQVIETLNGYGVKKVICTCPHCFNIIKNEYPELGGDYEVIHYSAFIQQLVDRDQIKVNLEGLKNKRITYHDPCYLGRGNGIYEAPRKVINHFNIDYREMKRTKSFSLCCGAGGAQMFKEAEKGQKEVYEERTSDVLATGANIVATACPFCMTMLTDGIKFANKEEEVINMDIAELIAQNLME